MKKALQLASVASMIDQFNMPNIKLLQDLGYKVDVLADFTNPGTITSERAKELKARLNSQGVRVFDIPIPRTLNIKCIIKAYTEVKAIIDQEKYELIHCHSPIGGVICRKAAKKARKRGTKVVYTAHGFHFYNGAPIKNWLIFYPIERHYSRYTDVLITINKEDYSRALRKFHAKRTVKIPGVGIDTQKYSVSRDKRETMRAELGLNQSDFVIISVGELNDNKNHSVIIEALSQLPHYIKYIIVGKGPLYETLKLKAKKIGVADRLFLVGYRTDVNELLSAADCFAFPSKREGLGLAALEGMATGLPVVGHDIGGIRDYVVNGETGWLCKSNGAKEYSEIFMQLQKNSIDSNLARKKSKEFDISIVEQIMLSVYSE